MWPFSVVILDRGGDVELGLGKTDGCRLTADGLSFFYLEQLVRIDMPLSDELQGKYRLKNCRDLLSSHAGVAKPAKK